jgi:putative lipoprotein
MKRRLTVSLLTIAALALSACGGSSSEAEVTGTIILPDGMTVPEGTTINVQIQDTSRADAAAIAIGEQIIDGAGQSGEIPFAVSYDPADIDDRFEYTMRVRIEDADGSLLFINDTSIPVITRGAPTEDVEIPVIAV